MALDLDQIAQCCQEAEKELLRIGAERCKFLTATTQLSAVVLLLLRSISLFRSMIHLLNLEKLDAFDSVRRSFLETWLLAFELRIKDSTTKAAKWHTGQGDSWSADIAKVEAYARSREAKAPKLGRYYGELSELAHPTRSASENSAALTTKRFGISTEVKIVKTAQVVFEQELPELLYRVLWLVLDEHEGLISLHINENALANAGKFVEEHPHL